jgi:hypothetical protein
VSTPDLDFILADHDHDVISHFTAGLEREKASTIDFLVRMMQFGGVREQVGESPEDRRYGVGLQTRKRQ